MMLKNVASSDEKQLHKIVSRELIKPSSPTLSHLKTYNLSILDQLMVDEYISLVLFYSDTNISHSCTKKTLDLKNSLSQTLTHYYPFAGRLPKTAPAYVDCNDDGVEFIVARHDGRLSDFLEKSKPEALGILFSKSRMSDEDENIKKSVLVIYVNHFACGGIALAVALNHKMADASSLLSFLDAWAATTRFNSGETKNVSPIHPPFFLSSERTNVTREEISLHEGLDTYVTRSFVFPNSKLNDLKLKVTAMTTESEQPIMNITRLEALNWLLLKCAVAAATKTNSGSFKSTGMTHIINIRDKMIEPLPETSIGNLLLGVQFSTANESEMTPNFFIGQMKKQKKDIRGLRNMETVNELLLPTISRTHSEDLKTKLQDYYCFSSWCRYPIYEIDFGWDKPVKVAFPGGAKGNSFNVLDTPNGDGIEAFVTLEEQDMAIFQSDPELLAFC